MPLSVKKVLDPSASKKVMSSVQKAKTTGLQVERE